MWEHVSPVLFLKMKITKWNLSLSREETSAILPWLTYLPSFKSVYPTLGPGSWNCFFIPKMPGRFFFQNRKKKKKVVILSVPVWKSNLCPHDGGETDTLQYKGVLEVAVHLDQREANMHKEKTCETLYMAGLVVVFSNDCLLSLFTSHLLYSLTVNLIRLLHLWLFSIPVSSSFVCTTEDLKSLLCFLFLAPVWLKKKKKKECWL